MKRIAFAALILLFAAAFVQAEDWQQSFAVTGTPSVRITVNDGSLRVEPGTSSKVDVVIYAPGYTKGADYVVTPSQAGNRIDVTIRKREEHFNFFGNTGRRFEVRVTVPTKSNLELETGDGRLDLRDVAGDIRAKTGDGRIEASHVSGTVALRTGDGAINATSIDGGLEARTGDGRIAARGRFEGLQLETGDGHIELYVEDGSHLKSAWAVRTNDGSVTAALPLNLAAELDVNTGDGRIQCDFPVTVRTRGDRNELHGQVNNGTQLFSIRTGDGNIDIRRR